MKGAGDRQTQRSTFGVLKQPTAQQSLTRVIRESLANHSQNIDRSAVREQSAARREMRAFPLVGFVQERGR